MDSPRSRHTLFYCGFNLLLIPRNNEGHKSLEKSAEDHYLFGCVISNMLKIVVGYLNIRNQSTFLVKND